MAMRVAAAVLCAKLTCMSHPPLSPTADPPRLPIPPRPRTQELRKERDAAVQRKAQAELDVGELEDRIEANSRTQVSIVLLWTFSCLRGDIVRGGGNASKGGGGAVGSGALIGACIVGRMLPAAGCICCTPWGPWPLHLWQAACLQGHAGSPGLPCASCTQRIRQ